MHVWWKEMIKNIMVAVVSSLIVIAILKTNKNDKDIDDVGEA